MNQFLAAGFAQGHNTLTPLEVSLKLATLQAQSNTLPIVFI